MSQTVIEHFVVEGHGYLPHSLQYLISTFRGQRVISCDIHGLSVRKKCSSYDKNLLGMSSSIQIQRTKGPPLAQYLLRVTIAAAYVVPSRLLLLWPS